MPRRAHPLRSLSHSPLVDPTSTAARRARVYFDLSDNPLAPARSLPVDPTLKSPDDPFAPAPRAVVERILHEAQVRTVSDRIVAFDDRGGLYSARLWHVLGLYGCPSLILRGGRAAWEELAPLVDAKDRDTSSRPPLVLSDAPNPTRIVTFADMAALARARNHGGTAAAHILVIDARSEAEYLGDPSSPRSGHIPGAVHVDWQSTVDPATGVLRDRTALRAIYEQALGSELRQASSAITYCRAGIRAAHAALALREAGFAGHIRVYDGSMSEYEAKGGTVDAPLVVGEE